jgi:hypothetical protein
MTDPRTGRLAPPRATGGSVRRVEHLSAHQSTFDDASIAAQLNDEAHGACSPTGGPQGDVLDGAAPPLQAPRVWSTFDWLPTTYELRGARMWSVELFKLASIWVLFPLAIVILVVVAVSEVRHPSGTLNDIGVPAGAFIVGQGTSRYAIQLVRSFFAQVDEKDVDHPRPR